MSYSNYFSQRDNSRTVNVTRNDTTTVRKIGNLEDNNLQDFTAKVDMEWKFMPNNQLEFGGQIAKNTINFTNTQNDTTTILNRYGEGTIVSAYVQDRLKAMNGRLQVIPGVRLNYFDATAKVYVEPRLSFNFNLSERVKLKGAGGIYHQFIKQINREDITQGNRNFWILADGNSLPVTRSEHIIIGGSYETPNYLFDVEFYQKKNTGVTEYSLRFVPQITPGQRGGGLNVEETFFNGDETIQGVDFLLQKKFGKFNGWLGYTLSQGYRNIGTFSDQAYYSDQDVRHQFKAIGTYNYKNWDLAATWIYSTGRPYTSIIGAYSIELLDGTTKSYTNPSDKNANRFIDYQRLDLSATYNFSKGSVGFSVFNTYNRTNIWYKRFEIIDESGVSALQTTDVTYLGITPNITLSLKLR